MFKPSLFFALTVASVLLVSLNPGFASEPTTTWSSSSQPNERGRVLASTVFPQVSVGRDADSSLATALVQLDSMTAHCLDPDIIAGSVALLSGQLNTNRVTPIALTYESSDIHGNRLELTGAVLIPQAQRGVEAESLPIISLQHGTQLSRLLAPSLVAVEPLQYTLDANAEVLLGYMLARAGFIVLMPDYPGMGPQTAGNPGFHPFTHGRSLGIAIVDMLRATKQYLGESDSAAEVDWNGQVFLIGYSEGGYATLAGAREIQQFHSQEFTVSAAAALSGPHDLTDVMLPIMRGEAFNSDYFPSPFFLPYVVSGYVEVYGAEIFGPDIVYADPYRELIPPLMDGLTDSKTVNCTIAEIQGRSIADSCYAALAPMFAPLFVDELKKTDSQVVRILKGNNLFLEDFAQTCSYLNDQGVCVWIPEMPVSFFHHPDDEMVPFGNSQNAYDQFLAAGSQQIALKPFLCLVPLSDTVHVNASLPAMLAGYGWLNQFVDPKVRGASRSRAPRAR